MDTHFDVESKQRAVYNIHKVYVWNHSLQHDSKKRNTLRHITKIPLVKKRKSNKTWKSTIGKILHYWFTKTLK